MSRLPHGNSCSATGGALIIRNVSKVYGPEGEHVVALQGIDLEIEAGPGKRLSPGTNRMVVFQQGALFPWKTVLWNVTCGLKREAVDPIHEKARSALEAGERELA